MSKNKFIFLLSLGDQLMYVKEDLIIPQTNTFYDFIVSRARGKSGPLFNFDVREDVRLAYDASVETEAELTTGSI